MKTELLTEVFPWREEYSVRVPEIDEQHKRLVGLINDLQSAMLGRQGDGVLGTILDELILYTETHFAYEEDRMRERGYPALARHRAEHARLTAEVVELREKFRTSRLSISVEVLRFLRQWLSGHIMEFDQAYAGWMAPAK
jgi:hemerythrin-like metal-binding protein